MYEVVVQLNVWSRRVLNMKHYNLESGALPDTKSLDLYEK